MNVFVPFNVSAAEPDLTKLPVPAIGLPPIAYVAAALLTMVVPGERLADKLTVVLTPESSKMATLPSANVAEAAEFNQFAVAVSQVPLIAPLQKRAVAAPAFGVTLASEEFALSPAALVADTT